MDRNEKSLAIVIKVERFKEKDKLITLFSPIEGVFKCIVYGAQKSIKSVKAGLYNEGDFVIYHNKERDSRSLVDLSLISIHENTQDSLETIFASALMSELVMLNRSETYIQLYNLFTSSLDVLNSENYQKVAIKFMLDFLSLNGVLTDFKSCPLCGKIYSKDEILYYNTSYQVPACFDCDSMSSSFILPPRARAFLIDVSNYPLSRVLSFNISDNQLERVFRYMQRYISLAFSVDLKVLKSSFLIK